jgi:hypothetical protein
LQVCSIEDPFDQDDWASYGAMQAPATGGAAILTRPFISHR